jgi:hypothetical protein
VNAVKSFATAIAGMTQLRQARGPFLLAKVTPKKNIWVAGLLVLAGLVSGCQTTFRTVNERFMAHPTNHRQVQILPLWFEGAGSFDRTLTTNDLRVLCRQTVKGLVDDIQHDLRSKGYELAGPARILRVDEISASQAAETMRCLAAVRVDLFKNLAAQYSASIANTPLTFRTQTTLSLSRYMSTATPSALEHNPFYYQVTPSLTNVLARFGATNAQAVLLVDTKAFFESEHNRTKRTVWNWTGGGLTAVVEVGANLAIIAVAALSGAGSAPVPFGFDPFWHSDNSIQQNIALVDVPTREVLWINQQDFKHQDPADAEALAGTVTDAMHDLPSRLPPSP